MTAGQGVSGFSAQMRGLVDPIVRACDLAVDDLTVSTAGSRRVVRIAIDYPDDTLGSPTLDEVAQVAREISAVLDVNDIAGPPYVLEVTSPGVDRPLTTPRHFRRNVRRKVVVTASQGPPIAGRLLAVNGPLDQPTSLTLQVPGAKRGTASDLDLPWESVTSARVEVEFKALTPDDEPESDPDCDLDETDLS